MVDMSYNPTKPNQNVVKVWNTVFAAIAYRQRTNFFMRQK